RRTRTALRTREPMPARLALRLTAASRPIRSAWGSRTTATGKANVGGLRDGRVTGEACGRGRPGSGGARSRVPGSLYIRVWGRDACRPARYERMRSGASGGRDSDRGPLAASLAPGVQRSQRRAVDVADGPRDHFLAADSRERHGVQIDHVVGRAHPGRRRHDALVKDDRSLLGRQIEIRITDRARRGISAGGMYAANGADGGASGENGVSNGGAQAPAKVERGR